MDKEFVELAFCNRLALEMNVVLASDYYAEKHTIENSDIDCSLVSRSARFSQRGFQVVTIPLGGDLRETRDSVLKFKASLSSRLKDCERENFGVLIDLTRSGRTRKWSATELEQLASLIRNMSRSGNLLLGDIEIWNRCPELSNFVTDVGLIPSPSVEGVVVNVTIGDFIPQDGEWIKEAIDQKIKKYGTAGAKSISLLIGAWGLVGHEQIDAFRQRHAPNTLPFDEIWIVSQYRDGAA